MLKFDYIKLKIHNGQLKIEDKEIETLKESSLSQYKKIKGGDVVYIYRGTRLRKIYIGQTTKFLERHVEHYREQDGSFKDADFEEVIVLWSRYLEGSGIIDAESQLITYFLAENPKPIKTLSKKSCIDKKSIDYEIMNRTKGNNVNDYEKQENVALEVVLPFWEKVLFKNGWVKNPTLDKLRNSALVKYSPIKKITNEQLDILNEIKLHHHKNFVINGDPGTGKTVLLTHLVASFLNKKDDKKIAVVVQSNWIDTAKEIFKVFGMKSSSLTIATSTQLINTSESYDVIIVDESHKLSRSHTKQMNSFNKVYKGDFSNNENHLEILKKIGSQIVLMYDVFQAIRPANITRTQFSEATKGFEKRFLKTQFRIHSPKGEDYTSEDFINGIKYLLYKDTGLLEGTKFKESFDRGIFKDNDSFDSYFGFFEEEPLRNLIEWVEKDRNFYPEHINRIVAGLVEPWKQAHGKDSSITHWHEGNIKRRWNSTQEKWINSKDLDAEDQIGSVFAVQGIDLNKVGVLIGNDLQVDNNGVLFGNPENFHNVNGKFSKDDDSPENEFEFTLFVLNIYYVLMTRGIDGIRLGFWKNDSFKEYMKEVLEIS